MINYSFSIYDLEYFLLILVRVTSFVYLAPFFSLNGVPRQVRIALSLFLSAMLYGMLTPADAVVTDSLLEYAIIVAKETICGLLMGFSTMICTSALNFAGTIADMEIGLSMVQILDPASRQNVSITGAFYNYGFTMILIASGMYRYLIGALADSFRLIPVNGVVFHWDHLMQSMIVFLGDYVLIGFEIILPIFCSVMMLNAILGIIARVSPQMNMFSIGIQLKIIVGLGVLMLTIGLMPKASDLVFDEVKKVMVLFVEGMME
ncbi:MAG: flagellar biosynthetic protein FliR [Lachnospiraceae bacterium]|jgi:flagellar biosynthetic protein FliR|nr:flagellar biosynthetic protein FliR [Lachnospiraceae bacterium]